MVLTTEATGLVGRSLEVSRENLRSHCEMLSGIEGGRGNVRRELREKRWERLAWRIQSGSE